MPYSLVDVLKNPYLVLLFASIAACTWALSVFSGTLTIFAVIGLLLALVLWCVILKRAIVGYVLDECYSDPPSKRSFCTPTTLFLRESNSARSCQS